MDTNEDGLVDENEFLAAGGSVEEFHKYDLDGDGVLDAREMELRGADMVDEQERKIHQQEHAIAAKHGREELKRMDTNEDGVADAKEFGAAGGSVEEFSKYDLDG